MQTELSTSPLSVLLEGIRFETCCPPDLQHALRSLATRVGMNPGMVFLELLQTCCSLYGDAVPSIGRAPVPLHTCKLIVIGSKSQAWVDSTAMFRIRAPGERIQVTDEHLRSQVDELHLGIRSLATSAPVFLLTQGAALRLQAFGEGNETAIRSYCQAGDVARAGLLQRSLRHVLQVSVLIHSVRECTLHPDTAPTRVMDEAVIGSAIELVTYFDKVRLAVHDLSNSSSVHNYSASQSQDGSHSVLGPRTVNGRHGEEPQARSEKRVRPDPPGLDEYPTATAV